MSTKHTAGQWKAYDRCLPAWGIIEIQADGKAIASIKRLVSHKCYVASECPEAEANAKLIAAAPDLLKALGDLCHKLQEHQTKESKIMAGYTLAANIEGMTELLNEALAAYSNAIN